MSEYWKSTPNYWCKFCKTYIRDTPLERKQHESTGRHQGAIQKSLRELHKTQGREERDAQRAKDEVARLNGLVPGEKTEKTGVSSASAPSVAKAKPQFTRHGQLQSTADDRKRQAEQLAAMGIAVPDEFRKDLSIAGGWSTVSSRVVYTQPPPPEIKDEDADSKDTSVTQAKGKRKLEDGEEDPEVRETSKRIWGSTTKSYPGGRGGDADDFDSLLSGKAVKTELKPELKSEPEELDGGIKLKTEETADDSVSALPAEAEPADAPVVFKKRKAKR